MINHPNRSKNPPAHTPGPWTSDNHTISSEGGHPGGGLFVVARLVQFEELHESEANARLIAAAPELEAFRSLVANLKPYYFPMGDAIVTLNRMIEEARKLGAKVWA